MASSLERATGAMETSSGRTAATPTRHRGPPRLRRFEMESMRPTQTQSTARTGARMLTRGATPAPWLSPISMSGTPTRIRSQSTRQLAMPTTTRPPSLSSPTRAITRTRSRQGRRRPRMLRPIHTAQFCLGRAVIFSAMIRCGSPGIVRAAGVLHCRAPGTSTCRMCHCSSTPTVRGGSWFHSGQAACSRAGTVTPT